MDYNTEIILRRQELLSTLSFTSSAREINAIKTEKRILSLVESRTEDGGVSHTEIAKNVGINRKNVTKYLRNLSAQGLIRRGKGRHGRYLGIRYAPIDTSLSAEIFAQLFVGRALGAGENIDIPEVTGPDIKPKPPYEGLKYELGRFIFDFSNTVGAYMSYTLIQSMNPNNDIAKNIRDAEEKDLVIQKWFSDVVLELQQYLLPIFKDYLQYCLPTIYDRCNKNDAYETLVRYQLLSPKYLFDTLMTNDLTSAFSQVYPNLWNTFEKIRMAWPKVLQSEKDEMELLSAKYKTQKKCKHNYKNLRVPSRHELNPVKSRTVRHCAKCHFTAN